MWQLKTISANNICAFRELNYSLDQAHTTVVFGNNMDDDSQNSNGSGKSALIECIALGITGEPLRNVKMDEIINDIANDAQVQLEFYNAALNRGFVVNRQISRKSPQSITTTIIDNGISEVVVKSSVAEYNKYVLEELGITKDDVYSNYILSKHKYQPFLVCSDREKKEIINRFSNGALVDESIAALESDMDPVNALLQKSELAVSELKGKVAAIEEQIANSIATAAERKTANLRKIEEWKESIALNRQQIRELEEKSRTLDAQLDSWSAFSETLGKLEESPGNLSEAYHRIQIWFASYGWNAINDYEEKSKSIVDSINKCIAEQERLSETIKSLGADLADIVLLKDKTEADNTVLIDKARTQYKENQNLMDSYKSTISQLRKSIEDLSAQESNFEAKIRRIKNELAGTITCPNCQHRFILNASKTVKELEAEMSDWQQQLASATQEREKTTDERQRIIDSSNQLEEQNGQIKHDAEILKAQILEMVNKVATAKGKVSGTELDAMKNDSQLNALNIQLSGLMKAMFDEAFSCIERQINTGERQLDDIKADIKRRELSIQSLESSIIELENASESSLLQPLNDSLASYNTQLKDAMEEERKHGAQLAEMVKQKEMFVEFKTYLANTKIQALNDITNEFLEAIGSDIRVAFSGYTVLKSGKIRDKISISLLRDGIDCGSFDKFSAGEGARVNLANILAMHKLTNSSCEDGKGLDLIVLDEVLDAADEQGLASIFEALNNLHVTSLVVSHGNIAEGYPYRLVVNKQNGISFI